MYLQEATSLEDESAQEWRRAGFKERHQGKRPRHRFRFGEDHSQNLIPGVSSFNSEYGKNSAPHGAKVKRIVFLQDEHAHAAHDVVEHNHEDADPAHRTEAADESLHDGPQPRQSFGEAKDAQQAEEPQDDHWKRFEDHFARRHLYEAHEDNEGV